MCLSHVQHKYSVLLHIINVLSNICYTWKHTLTLYTSVNISHSYRPSIQWTATFTVYEFTVNETHIQIEYAQIVLRAQIVSHFSRLTMFDVHAFSPDYCTYAK